MGSLADGFFIISRQRLLDFYEKVYKRLYFENFDLILSPFDYKLEVKQPNRFVSPLSKKVLQKEIDMQEKYDDLYKST